jgi:multisubunit Na+/H+ antiporter MnhF subunit
MRYSKDIRPIIILSYVLIGSGIIGIFMSIRLLYNPNFENSFRIFIITLTGWHLLTGIGIISLRRWGFLFLKFYLCVVYIGFPIGTIIASKFFRHIRSKNVKVYFQ